MDKIKLRELGYYWVEWEIKDNWLIFWFNGEYWNCVAMGKISIDNMKILTVDERKLNHSKI